MVILKLKYLIRDSFPFQVISLPFIQSNIDSRICYKVFYSQVLRYERLSSYLEDFEDRVRMLGVMLLDRGYKREMLSREFRQVIGVYRSEFERWNIPAESQLWFNNIFNNPLNNIIPGRQANHTEQTPFSQPHPEVLGPRINFFSQ